MRYFFWFWTTIIREAFNIIRRRKHETKRAYTLLMEIEKKFDGKFKPATLKKIAVSYGIYNPMICDSFTRLRGRLTLEEEQIRFIHYFICSSLFDDFTDYHLITENQLYELSFQPEHYEAHSFDEKVFRYAHQFLRDFVNDKTSYDNISKELYKAQQDSKKQIQSSLSDSEIKAITFSKGGNSVLLCRYYLNLESTEIEDKCWYTIGTLIQLTNDLYDIHKDLQDHITTLPNRMRDAYGFEQFFTQRIKEMKSLIRQLPYPSRNKQHFSLAMAGIYAFGLIAIEQLKKIQGDADQLPELKSLSRKELIIDMEKPGNLLKWFKFTYRFSRI